MTIFFFEYLKMTTLAKPNAFTGPLDDIVVVDVYKEQPPSTVINRITEDAKSSIGTAAESIKDLAKGSVNDAIDSIKSALDNPKELVNDLIKGDFEKILGGSIPTKEEALSMLKGIAGDALGSIGNLETLKQDFLTDVLSSVGFKSNAKELAAGLLGVPGSVDPIKSLLGVNPKFKVIYDGVEFVKNKGDAKSAGEIANLLSGVLGNGELAKVLNVESQFAFMNTALTKSFKLGIPGIADTMMNSATTPEEKASLALNLANGAFKNSRLDTITTIVNNVSKDRLESENPNAVKQILKGFNLVLEDGSPNGQVLNSGDFLGVLDTVKSDWSVYTRNGQPIVDLNFYLEASRDSIALLQADPVHRVNVMTALMQTGHSTNFYTLAKAAFPKAAIKG